MLVQDFKNNVVQYENFEIWDVENIHAFFKGNGVVKEIFEKEYKIPYNQFEDRRSEIPETNIGLIAAILDQIADKHFYIFTKGDPNHNELIHMQEAKIMTFGINIANIDLAHVYIVIMDKTKKVGVGY